MATSANVNSGYEFKRHSTLIVEFKAARTLADEHVAQVLGHLKSARIEHGLLINFGSHKVETRKYALSAARTQGHPGGILALFGFSRKRSPNTKMKTEIIGPRV